MVGGFGYVNQELKVFLKEHKCIVRYYIKNNKNNLGGVGRYLNPKHAQAILRKVKKMKKSLALNHLAKTAKCDIGILQNIQMAITRKKLDNLFFNFPNLIYISSSIS